MISRMPLRGNFVATTFRSSSRILGAETSGKGLRGARTKACSAKALATCKSLDSGTVSVSSCLRHRTGSSKPIRRGAPLHAETSVEYFEKNSKSKTQSYLAARIEEITLQELEAIEATSSGRTACT